ncbi:MAG: diguanylate cyclase [Thermoleophilia bacterium]
MTGIVLLDLDAGFKNVNDTFGHRTGDRLLVEVAARLRRAQRAHDVLLRLGGDEFAVVLVGMPTWPMRRTGGPPVSLGGGRRRRGR